MNLFPVMAISMVCACLSLSAKANTTTIIITGEVLPEICDIDVQQLNQTINLGDYSVTDFKQTGSVTKSVPFSLVITKCPSDITSAKIHFGGTLSGGLFSLGGDGSIGLELLNVKEAQITPNTPITFALKGGYNKLDFAMRLKSLRNPVTPGELNATLTMDIEYE
ncbi:fimbrial protein [Aeromonas hydrophila]|uniref:fimbrial protein n=1 Tax=Aeromonas hydrophila TaxID=644 RepID=UPI0038CF69FB